MPPVAVVTGAAAGIGRETVLWLAERAISVVAWDVDQIGLAALQEEADRRRWAVTGYTVDVADEASVAKAAAICQAQYGAVRYLFNSAGIQTYGTIIDTASPAFEHTLRVNVFGHYYTAKYVVPFMETNGTGAVVNTTSAQALQCQDRVLAYAASKGAILSMTKSMALDLASKGIRVNAIAPGSVDTPMLRKAAQFLAPDDPEQAVADWGALHPLGRVGHATEVARLVGFLLLEATFMTGAIVSVDGCLTARLM